MTKFKKEEIKSESGRYFSKADRLEGSVASSPYMFCDVGQKRAHEFPCLLCA